MVKYLIFFIVLAFLLVIFALQNATPVIIQFISWKYEGSIAVVILSSFTLGAITGLIFMLLPKRKHKEEPIGQAEKEEKKDKIIQDFDLEVD